MYAVLSSVAAAIIAAAFRLSAGRWHPSWLYRAINLHMPYFIMMNSSSLIPFIPGSALADRINSALGPYFVGIGAVARARLVQPAVAMLHTSPDAPAWGIANSSGGCGCGATVVAAASAAGLKGVHFSVSLISPFLKADGSRCFSVGLCPNRHPFPPSPRTPRRRGAARVHRTFSRPGGFRGGD